MSRFSLSLRLSSFLGAVFLAIGTHLPFWPIFLEGKGLSAAEIGTVIAAASWARVFGVPLWGRIADPPGRGRPTLLALSLVGAALYSVFFFVEGYGPALLLQALIGFITGALVPLGDSQILGATRDQGIDYGRIRLWGSATFIGGNLIGGWLIALSDRDWYLAAIVLPLLATAAAAWSLPRRPPDIAAKPPIRVRALLSNKTFLALLAVTCLLQASHGAFHVVSALSWRAAGFSDSTIAWLWAEGVVAEILLLAAGKHLLLRFPVTLLLALGGGAGVIRWSVTALSVDLGLLIAVQLLHGVTFAVVHLASVTEIARIVPRERLSSAQALHTAIHAGIFLSGSIALAGWLYDISGREAAFGAMAGFSLLGLGALWLLRGRLGRPLQFSSVP